MQTASDSACFMALAQTQTSEMAYNIFAAFWWKVLNVFFREIRVRGAFNIPRDGPVIFVGAPHHNQFLDLLMALQVHRETGRQVRHIVAAKSMDQHVIGFFARIMASIPVVRAFDEATAGTGLVSLSADDPCVVVGNGTRFLSELTPKMHIMLPRSVDGAAAEVVEVVSNTELRVKNEFSGNTGACTSSIRAHVDALRAEGTQGLSFKRVPLVSQQEMFRYVYECLTKDGCIGIFPEGTSHDRSDLLPLKAGVSLMALGAMANDPSVKVKIVPVGLSYFHPHRFRSRAVVEFGSAMDVPQNLVELFKQGGAQKRQAVGELLDMIFDGIKTVTIRTPDFETLLLVQAARRLYKTPGQPPTLAQVVELNKRYIEGYLHFKEEPKVQQLRTDVLKYDRLVRDLGLRDHQVPQAQNVGWKTLGLLAYRLGLLTVWTTLALPGAILNGPLFLTASIISRRKAKAATSASLVKLKGRDVVATWKILIFLGLAPLLYVFYALLATLTAIKMGASAQWQTWTPILVLTALPCVAYAALKFGEAGLDVFKSLRPLIIALVPGQQRSLDGLKAMRVQVANELAEVIGEYGPKLYEDFDDRRMPPLASAPPSSSHPGIWRRKSGTGGVDAQGTWLVHPMTWLDERLFGWSRGAKTCGGSDSTPSLEGSRATTPDFSDEDEVGDYDSILRCTEGLSQPHPPQPRSHQGLYADLQKLRQGAGVDLVAVKVSGEEPGSTTEGLHLRHVRKASLSDTVSVERICVLSKEENFKEATQHLNREIRERRMSEGYED
ncbi:glycerol-3-phosphate O-acyltransferase [Amylocystis lapponica]|nr:glycerol-3-phosphate O-acyltransferase [Amylocystis lapponica]